MEDVQCPSWPFYRMDAMSIAGYAIKVMSSTWALDWLLSLMLSPVWQLLLQQYGLHGYCGNFSDDARMDGISTPMDC